MSTTVYLTSLCIPFGTILLVFGMRYFALIQQARARLANDDAYRRIAEKAAAAETETATTLSTLQATLADVRARLAAIEKVLKDVE
jgi:Tfp pilus assembly protein PilO